VIYFLIAFFPQTFEAENVQAPFSIFMTFASVWSLADVLTFLFSDKRRALHDFLAGTVVVKTNV